LCFFCFLANNECPIPFTLFIRFRESVRERLAKLMEDPNSQDKLQELLVDEFNLLFPASRYVIPQSSEPPDNSTEPFLLRLFILWLLTACCYGVQVLAARQRGESKTSIPLMEEGLRKAKVLT
jgi:hypothetical protein